MNKLVLIIAIIVMIQSIDIVYSCPGSVSGIRVVYDEYCLRGLSSRGCNAGM
jgi:hypothetical protein